VFVLQEVLGALEATGHGQEVLHHLVQLIAHEEALQGVLHTFDHFEQVLQDLLRMALVGLHPDAAHCDQQLDTGDDVSRVLHALVEVLHVLTLLVELLELPL